MSAPDFIIYSSDHRPVLVVEVKAGNESSPEELERTRQNLMNTDDIAKARFLLLAQRNGLFLWAVDAAPGTKPKFATVKSVLRDYAPSIAGQEDSLRAAAIRMVIQSWLDDLALGIRKPQADSEADQLLVDSGIYAQIEHGGLKLSADSGRHRRD